MGVFGGRWNTFEAEVLTRSGPEIPAVGHSEGVDFLVWTRLSSESLDSLYSLVHLIP